MDVPNSNGDRLIFLDIDGVLNIPKYQIYRVETGLCNRGQETQEVFCPDAMMYLRKLIEETDAKIVISSSWRILRKDGDFGSKFKDINKLNKYGHLSSWATILKNFLTFKIPESVIIGVTPVIGTANRKRGDEIRQYIQEYEGTIRSFIIIDDSSDMEEFTTTHLVKCTWDDGFTEREYVLARQMLLNGR